MCVHQAYIENSGLLSLDVLFWGQKTEKYIFLLMGQLYVSLFLHTSGSDPPPYYNEPPTAQQVYLVIKTSVCCASTSCYCTAISFVLVLSLGLGIIH